MDEDVGWCDMLRYPYISDDKVTRNQVEDLIAKAFILVKEAIVNNKIFRTPLKIISDELIYLKHQLDKMGKDDDLMEAIINERKGIYMISMDCHFLIWKCSRIYRWKLIEKRKCSNELVQLSSRIQCCLTDLRYTSARWELQQVVLPHDEVVTGGVVGRLVTQTTMLIEETISITKSFEIHLPHILRHVKSLECKFIEMEKDNAQMNLANEELRPFYDFLRRPCKILLFRCMKFPKYTSYIEKEKYRIDLDNLENELVSFCNTIDLSYMIDTKAIKDVIVVESAAGGGYGMYKLCVDEQVTETENNKGLEDVPVSNDIQHHELLDGSEPDVMVESTASTLVGNEQVTAISYEYDVFLSFRGDDTRESFTSTLFYALSKVYKIKTFMDVIFRKGSKLEELLKMVEKSRMSIVVFSENFAESEWCLKELAKIFEESDRRGHEVVPVFYKVHPSELRHQDFGKTKGHMEKHHNTYGKDSDTVKSWSNAIKELGNSSGYTYWAGRGNLEIDLAEDIAQDIWTRLNGRQGYLSKPTHIIFILVLSFLVFYFLSAKLVIIPW